MKSIFTQIYVSTHFIDFSDSIGFGKALQRQAIVERFDAFSKPSKISRPRSLKTFSHRIMDLQFFFLSFYYNIWLYSFQFSKKRWCQRQGWLWVLIQKSMVPKFGNRIRMKLKKLNFVCFRNSLRKFLIVFLNSPINCFSLFYSFLFNVTVVLASQTFRLKVYPFMIHSFSASGE